VRTVSLKKQRHYFVCTSLQKYLLNSCLAHLCRISNKLADWPFIGELLRLAVWPSDKIVANINERLIRVTTGITGDRSEIYRLYSGFVPSGQNPRWPPFYWIVDIFVSGNDTKTLDKESYAIANFNWLHFV